MIYVHEVHDVRGGKMPEFSEAMRYEWRSLLEEHGDARLLWFWELTHGTGSSYQAVSITAVRDWATWGATLARLAHGPRGAAWQKRVWTLRHEVTSKILLPTAWSPLTVDLSAPAADARPDRPSLYLHDTGWPFTGMLDEYTNALGDIFYPQVKHAKMISVAACWTVAPGTGKHHEVVLLQKIEDWEKFSMLLSHGEQGAQKSGWMVEGLRFRDRWESKLLRCAAWSPRQ